MHIVTIGFPKQRRIFHRSGIENDEKILKLINKINIWHINAGLKKKIKATKYNSKDIIP